MRRKKLQGVEIHVLEGVRVSLGVTASATDQEVANSVSHSGGTGTGKRNVICVRYRRICCRSRDVARRCLIGHARFIPIEENGPVRLAPKSDVVVSALLGIDARLESVSMQDLRDRSE